jgi:hypothetical protein
MTSGSITWGADLNEGPNKSGATPFPEENIIMIAFEGRPLFGGCRKSSLGPRISTHGGWGHGAQGCNGASYLLHPSKNIDIYIYIYLHMFLQSSPEVKQKKEKEGRRGLVPRAGAEV